MGMRPQRKKVVTLNLSTENQMMKLFNKRLQTGHPKSELDSHSGLQTVPQPESEPVLLLGYLPSIPSILPDQSYNNLQR